VRQFWSWLPLLLLLPLLILFAVHYARYAVGSPETPAEEPVSGTTVEIHVHGTIGVLRNDEGAYDVVVFDTERVLGVVMTFEDQGEAVAFKDGFLQGMDYVALAIKGDRDE
jgi:hypothetical protein